MKHKCAEFQIAKYFKIIIETRRILMTYLISSTQFTSHFVSQVDLIVSSLTSYHDSALIHVLKNIILTIHKNIRKMKKVFISVNNVLSFIQNKVCFLLKVFLFCRKND